MKWFYAFMNINKLAFTIHVSLRIAHEHPWVQSAVQWYADSHESYYGSSVETLAAWFGVERNV